MPEGVQINIPNFAPPANTLASPYFWGPVGQGVQSGIQAAIERRRQRRQDELARQMQEHQMRTEEQRLGISREQLELTRRSQRLAEEQARYARESQYVDVGQVLSPQALQEIAQTGIITLPEGYQPGQPLKIDQRIWQQVAPELTKTPQQRELERLQLSQSRVALADLEARFSGGMVPKTEAEAWIETLPERFRGPVRGMMQPGDDGREYLYMPAVRENLGTWLESLGGALELQTGEANLKLLQSELAKIEGDRITREQALELLRGFGFDEGQASSVVIPDDDGKVSKQSVLDIATLLSRREIERLQSQGLRLENLYNAATLDDRREMARSLVRESQLKIQLLETDLEAARETLDQLQGLDRQRKERELELLGVQIEQEKARLAIIRAEAEGGGVETLLGDGDFMAAYDRTVKPYIENGYLVPSPLEYAQYIAALETGEVPQSFAAFVRQYDEMARYQAGLDPRERNPLPWNQEGFWKRYIDQKNEFDSRFGGNILATGAEAQRPPFPSPEIWWANEQAGKPLSDEELIEAYNMEDGEGINYLRRKFAQQLGAYGIAIPGTVPFEDWYAAVLSVEGFNPTVAYRTFLEATPMEQEKDALEVGMTVEELRSTLKERAEEYEAGVTQRIEEVRQDRWPRIPGVRGPGTQTFEVPGTGTVSLASPFIPGVRGPGSMTEQPIDLGALWNQFISRAFPPLQESAQQLQQTLPGMAQQGVAPFASGGTALGEAIRRRLEGM